MPEQSIGIIFDRKTAGSATYGFEFWKLFFGTVPDSVLRGCLFYHGDRADQDEQFCIGISTTREATRSIVEALWSGNVFRKCCTDMPFLIGESYSKEPLVYAGEITANGEVRPDLQGNDFQRAHDAVAGGKAAQVVDREVKWPGTSIAEHHILKTRRFRLASGEWSYRVTPSEMCQFLASSGYLIGVQKVESTDSQSLSILLSDYRDAGYGPINEFQGLLMNTLPRKLLPVNCPLDIRRYSGSFDCPSNNPSSFSFDNEVLADFFFVKRFLGAASELKHDPVYAQRVIRQWMENINKYILDPKEVVSLRISQEEALAASKQAEVKKKEERKQRASEQALRDSEQARYERSIMLSREMSSLCRMCGKRLTLLDRLARRSQHKGCYGFRA